MGDLNKIQYEISEAMLEESAKNADMLLVDDLLKPYLCSGVGSINGWVCR